MNRQSQTIATAPTFTKLRYAALCLGFVLAIPPTSVTLAHEALITGEIVDESSIKKTIRVGPAADALTLREGFQLAVASLATGTPTRLILPSGVFRESVDDIRLDGPDVRDTLFVIEGAGPGKTIWTGADAVPPTAWTSLGNQLFRCDWPHQFGNFCYPWGVGTGIGPRREIVMADGELLRPIILEEYSVTGLKYFGGDQVTFTHTQTRLAADTLKPGEFGVTERDKNSRHLFVKLPPGISPLPGATPVKIEAGIRPSLLNAIGKKGLVVRGISFQNCANSDRELGTEAPINFGWDSKAAAIDVLIENCHFRGNSTVGLSLTANRLTLRDTTCEYNGFSGIAIRDSRNVLFERVSTNFNCWREFLAGGEDWNYGGIKTQATQGHLVKDHTSVGNADHGMWWDIHCKNVVLDGATLVYNRRSFIFELSEGPFWGRKILAVNGYRERSADGAPNPAVALSTSNQARLESSILYSRCAPEVLAATWYERDDEHARQQPLVADLYQLEKSVVVGAGPPEQILVAEANVGDRQQPSFRTFRFQGKENTFFQTRPGKAPFTWRNLNFGFEHESWTSWTATGREVGGQFTDPKFENPAIGDFRFQKNSPLAKRTDLPAKAIDRDLLNRAAQYYRWLGWDHPGLLTTD